VKGRIVRLTGSRVEVRPFAESDLTGDYVAWLNDPEVVRYSNQRFRTHTLESCRQYLAGFAGSVNQFLSIRSRETDRAIGTMSVYHVPQHGTADVGIMLGDRAEWGKGIGQDAWTLVIDWLVGDGGLRKVTAGTLGCNIPMLRLMQRSGMHEEAIRRAQELVDGRPEDIIHYARFAAN